MWPQIRGRRRIGRSAWSAIFFAGAAVRVDFTEPYYVGLGVCSHNKDVVERAVFSNVSVGAPPAEKGVRVRATLETLTLSSTDRRVVVTTGNRAGGAAWTPDGKALVYSDRDQLLRVPLEGGPPQAVDTGDLDKCGFRFGFSPDGATLAFSDASYRDGDEDLPSRWQERPSAVERRVEECGMHAVSSGAASDRAVSAEEKKLCTALGRRLATIAVKLDS